MKQPSGARVLVVDDEPAIVRTITANLGRRGFKVDIARTADASIVVLVPGTGDEIQALKAGIMEIADIFVINQADRDGADKLAQAIAANQALKPAGAPGGRHASPEFGRRSDRTRRPRSR